MAVLCRPLGHREGEEWVGVGSDEAADLRKGLGEGWGDEVGRLKGLQEDWANGEEGEGHGSGEGHGKATGETRDSGSQTPAFIKSAERN